MSDEPAVPKTGLCWYGLQSLPPLLDAFSKEIEGVKTSEDIEYIHRMRVASRRLRAALPLFRSCFPQKQYRRWMREITSITRALGEARDADVQITFLSKYKKKQSRLSSSSKKKTPGEERATDPAIRYLLSGLQKKRTSLQSKVISALLELEKSKVTGEMQTTFSDYLSTRKRVQKKSRVYGISPVAALRIEKKLHELLSYEQWISNPDAVAEHHATRIAAKKLRYTMEVYGPLYQRGLKKIHARVKKVQEILGDLHDCDVWIDQVTLLLLKERALLRSDAHTKRPDAATISSLNLFLQERRKERTLLHRKFMRYWQALERQGIWHELSLSLVEARKTKFRPHAKYNETEVSTAVRILALEYPQALEHCRHVTDLALMIFDDLTALHQLDTHERFLLECAGMLHDIGWKYGQRRHNIRSADMIMSDENLPFDIPERMILSLVVRSHRGNADPETSGFFRLLSPEYQKQVLVLSAILRIADGLDYLHLGTIQAVSCLSGEQEISVTVTASGDPSIEKQRAAVKSDLFMRVFNRKAVIH